MSGVFFQHCGKNVDWEQIANGYVDYGLKAYWGNTKLGQIDLSSYDRRTKTFHIVHFAVWKNMVGHQIEGRSAATTMALVFRDAVKYNLNAEMIAFQENHPDYWEIPYARFFLTIGAVPRRGNHPKRPAWCWKWGSGDVRGEDWWGCHQTSCQLPKLEES